MGCGIGMVEGRPIENNVAFLPQNGLSAEGVLLRKLWWREGISADGRFDSKVLEKIGGQQQQHVSRHSANSRPGELDQQVRPPAGCSVSPPPPPLLVPGILANVIERGNLKTGARRVSWANTPLLGASAVQA